jgi:hypothetical protein
VFAAGLTLVQRLGWQSAWMLRAELPVFHGAFQPPLYALLPAFTGPSDHPYALKEGGGKYIFDIGHIIIDLSLYISSGSNPYVGKIHFFFINLNDIILKLL